MLKMLMIFLSRSPDEESEEEILEGSPPDQEQQQQPRQTTSQDNGHVDPEEENTDDEIERVMNANKVFTHNNDKTSPNGGRNSKSGNCL